MNKNLISGINKTKIQLDNEHLTITGIQCNDVLLTNSSKLVLCGILNGSLFINDNSVAIIDGTVNGCIFGKGSITINGVVNGSIDSLLNCHISDSAIIKNN